MEDDLNFLENGRQPTFFPNGRQPTFCFRQPRELIFSMQPYLTQQDKIWRTTQILLKWKTTSLDISYPSELFVNLDSYVIFPIT